jgi:multimeric flavodoxin WrbA
MKVVAINGSARKNGNTAKLIEYTFRPLQEAGIETEMLQLAGREIPGCTACYKCFENKDKRCVLKDGTVNECIEKMLGADGIILASPTYFADMTAQMKALVDRAGMVSRANDDMFRRKVGAAIVAVRRAGAIQAFDSLNHFFLIGQMIVPGSCYWNIGIGRNIGEVENDAEGIKTMTVLGENMTWLLKQLSA